MPEMKPDMDMPFQNDHSTAVMIGGGGVTTLGVIRGLGRHGIPVVFLDSNEDSTAVRYSRYITKRLSCPSPGIPGGESQFVDFLLDFGRRLARKTVIIPSGDLEVLALSKYKKELEQFYLLPISSYETTQKLVNKKGFYQLLAQMSMPHPKTYFPESMAELKLIGQEVGYPYIIKPVYSSVFGKEFHQKCFVINSAQELAQAVDKLKDKNLEVVIQEIIPGDEKVYMFYTYLNKESEPLAIYGYDKLRLFPADFGFGTLCQGVWRQEPIDLGISVLKTIGYHGLAEPELKKDPRDGKYKFIEINARPVTVNRLPAGCGVDIEYIAYLDSIGQPVTVPSFDNNGTLWVNDFYDLLSCLRQLRGGWSGIKEIFRSMKGKRIHSVAAWDDPFPFLIYPFTLGGAALRRLFYEVKSAIKR